MTIHDSIKRPNIAGQTQKRINYPPEVLHRCHAAVRVLGVLELGVKEELAHHLRVVVHGRARHAKRHCG